MRRIVAMLALLVMLGCRSAPPPAPPPPPPAEPTKTPELFIHRITFSGQTLSSIAKWYTGDASNWRQMVDPVNTGLTECCARLKVGRVIYIPRDLVTQTKSMPLPKTETRRAKPLVKEEPKAEPEKAEAPKAEPTEVPQPSKEADEAELPDDAPPPKAEPTAKPEPTAAPEPAPEEEDEEILGPR